MRTWALLAAGWARRPRHHLHSGPLRPNPTPPTPLHAKSRITYPRRRNLSASAQTTRPSAHLPTSETHPATQRRFTRPSFRGHQSPATYAICSACIQHQPHRMTTLWCQTTTSSRHRRPTFRRHWHPLNEVPTTQACPCVTAAIEGSMEHVEAFRLDGVGAAAGKPPVKPPRQVKPLTSSLRPPHMKGYQ